MLRIFFIFIAFLSSFLLFTLEFIIGKEILPFYGGSPATWNTCLFFYQLVLLFGYLTAHLLSKLKNTKKVLVIHILLFVLASAMLPVSFEYQSYDHANTFAVIVSLISLLVVGAGLPFFVLSIMSPILQKYLSLIHI